MAMTSETPYSIMTFLPVSCAEPISCASETSLALPPESAMVQATPLLAVPSFSPLRSRTSSVSAACL